MKMAWPSSPTSARVKLVPGQHGVKVPRRICDGPFLFWWITRRKVVARTANDDVQNLFKAKPWKVFKPGLPKNLEALHRSSEFGS